MGKVWGSSFFVFPPHAAGWRTKSMPPYFPISFRLPLSPSRHLFFVFLSLDFKILPSALFLD